MESRFNNCIAIGVQDMRSTAEAMVRQFGGAITEQQSDWIEVTTGPYRFYFVEDGTTDIAFSVNCQKSNVTAFIDGLAEDGFAVDEAISHRVGETFVRDKNRILININETD
ncbi:MAG: hypothetical protein KF812_11475 [Fimbriimonadaceae bacterium]|nr:hypothetical protein [Fimbriimonadaceae bacterium]